MVPKEKFQTEYQILLVFFVSNKLIRLVCIDDILFYNSPNKTDIEGVLSNMKELKMELNVNADVTGFLGISMKRLDNNKIELTQLGLNQENN